MAGPGLRHHHHHRVRQRTSCKHQHLESVVEHSGVAAGRVDDWQDLRQICSEEFRLKLTFTSVHPVDVAPQRIDLSVVRDIAIRVGASPARKGVGTEARMDQCE